MKLLIRIKKLVKIIYKNFRQLLGYIFSKLIAVIKDIFKFAKYSAFVFFVIILNLLRILANFSLAIFKLISSITYYYSEYKSHKPKKLKIKLQEIKRVVKLAYKHQVKPILTKGIDFKLDINLKRLYNPQILRSLGLLLIAVVFFFTLFNPNETLKATSLTWSTNADFSANRPGKCGETTSSSIIVSGNSYIDPACSDPGEDSSISLEKGGVFFSEIKQVSSGAYHTLILKEDGTVWAWGSNAFGQLGNNSYLDESLPIQVKSSNGSTYLDGITSISAGSFHSMALKDDGTVWAWGLNSQMWTSGGWSANGQVGDGTRTNRSLPVQVVDNSGLGFLTDVSAISAGSYSSYAVTSDGTVWSWGGNNRGQLGIGSWNLDFIRPQQMKNPDNSGPLINVKSVSASKYIYTRNSTLILLNDGSVYAVGLNENGQLGDGTKTNRNLPVQVKDSEGTGFLSGVVDISASTHSLVLKNDGTVWAWGLNSTGQLGDGTSIDKAFPVEVKEGSSENNLSDVAAITKGISGGSMILKNDGTVWVWGDNTYGQLGQDNNSQSSVAIKVKSEDGSGFLENIKNISGGVETRFAVSNNGVLYGWGLNTARSITTTNLNFQSGPKFSSGGQAGFGESVQQPSKLLPERILSSFTSNLLNGVAEVSAGPNFSVALKNDGTVWTWGNNSNGQLGDGTTNQRYLPVQVRDSSGAGFLSNIKSISAGGGSYGSFVLALDDDGTVWSWGSGASGELGNGTNGGSSLPIKVKDPTGTSYLNNVVKVAAGSYFAGAIKDDGSVWMWGDNGTGQLGDGTGQRRTLPVQVKDSSGTGFLYDFVDISLGHNFHQRNGGSSIAVKNDGTVWSWGSNTSGVLGDGTYTNRNLPVQVKDSSGTNFFEGAKSVEFLSSNDWLYGGSLIVKNDGTVWSWGYGNGPLGHNTTPATIPQQVRDSSGTGNLSNIEDVKCGHGSCLAIDNTGALWGWGGNSYGQLGNGQLSSSYRFPIKIKEADGVTDLSEVKGISINGYGISPGTTDTNFALIVKNDGSVLASGGNISGQLGNYSNVNSIRFTNVLSSVIFTDGHLPNGESSGYIVDQGPTKKTKWLSVNWNTEALPAKTSIKFFARTSNNGASWSDWLEAGTQDTPNSTSGSANLSSLPFSRYIELKVQLANTDFFSSPTLNDFSLTILDDQITPPDNASNIVMKKSLDGATIQEESWNNSAIPYFSWDAGQDNAGGSGIGAYCLYLGQDSSADVLTTKGILGNSPVDTDGKCQFAVPSNSLDLSLDGMLSEAIPSSNSNYYLLVKALDNSGNIYDGNPASFVFKHDVTLPNNVSFVSLPSQFIATKDVTITWPTTGAQAASDTNSGLAGLQYRIGNNGTWQGLNHNGNQDLSDLLPNSGSYQTDPTHDYPLLSDGNNLIYFRSIDNAGNISSSLTSAVIKINSSAPSSPQELNVTPQSNTTNSFAFTWQQPATFVGAAANLTYCYTVNTLPTVNTCTYTAPGQTGLGASAYANQPGENTFYVVAKDEAGNINYATAASVTFEANTPAPGLPLNLEASDISVKATQDWKLALSWAKPTNQGAGVAQYRIYRSTDANSGFVQIASTSGQGYFDADLNQVEYYYKVKACDSANNCGAETPVVSKLPTGRFTSPAEIIGSPSAQVSTRKVTVNWVTERESDSKIQFGTESGNYRETEISNSDQTKSHTLDVEGLEAGTTYYYRVLWTDEDGNTGRSSEMMFTTLPAPVVKNVSVIRKTLTTATIQFTSKDATAVNILYGRTESFGGLETINTSASESTYTVELEGLDDGVTYFFRPDAIDADGFTYNSNILFTFTTPERPRISELRFQPIEGEPTSTQQVTWRTNVPTTSQITYGIVNTTGANILDTTPKTEHSLIIKDLQDNSSYFLLAQGRDQDGNLATSDQQTFRTALDSRPPKVLDVTVESSVKGTGGDARGQIVITWRTDEPSTSQVIYGDGGGSGNYNRSTVESSGLKTEHTVVISDLNVSRVYTLRPVSKDAAGNETRGDEQSAIVGRPTDSTLNIILNILTGIFGL